MYRIFLGMVAVVVAIWSITTAAEATCLASGFLGASGQGYCNGCQYHGVITTGRNEPCDRQFQQPGNGGSTSDLAYLGTRIVQKAKHGVAGAGGNALAYQPDKDYVGSDDFTVEVTYKQYGVSGKVTTHYEVTIK
jgi:hypothetical protein